MLKKSAFRVAILVVCAVAVCTSCARVEPVAPVPVSQVISAPVGPVVSELEYRSIEEMNPRPQYTGSGYVQMWLRPPERLSEEPVYFSKRPLYGEINLGDAEDSKYVLVIDESKGTRSGYDTLYIDANNNEDLTDDAKVVAKSTVNSQMTEFPQVELAVEYGGSKYPYYLTPQVYSFGDTQVNWSSAGYCEGEITFGDKTYRVALFDDTCNGAFNDAYAIPRGYPRSGAVNAQGDTLVIDVNGDGEFRKHIYDTPEMYHVGKYVSFGDKCYELEIDPSGRKVTVRESESPHGYVTTDQDGYSVELLGDDGALKLAGSARTLKVPAGEYRFAGSSFEVKDDDGGLWKMIGRGDWRQNAISVNPGENAEVPFGPPLTASVKATRSGNSFQFSLEIKGQGGETYAANEIQKDGSLLPPPRFEVRNGDGETIASADFAYG
jgi:hypothetical protein